VGRFNVKWAIFLIGTISLVVIIAALFVDIGRPVHIRGVNLNIYTVPPKVTVGDTFSLKSIVFNNSTETITFTNGGCTSPVSVTFNKNVIVESHEVTASCKGQLVKLNPGEQLLIFNPGTTYKATSFGITNATMTFKYGVVTPTSKSPFIDSISRVYTFNIMPASS
jgi:hypothetical protein